MDESEGILSCRARACNTRNPKSDKSVVFDCVHLAIDQKARPSGDKDYSHTP